MSQKKKKVGHVDQTYDMIKGREMKTKEVKVPELDIKPTCSLQKALSQTGFSDISEVNRGQLTDNERIVIISPDKSRGTAIEE